MKTTLDELQAFAAVVDSGSITGAAERLGQTVSGVSRSMGRLEKKLDTTLLRRTTRRIALTEEGRAFLLHARAILASIDEAEEQMAARRQTPAGPKPPWLGRWSARWAGRRATMAWWLSA